MQYIYGKNLVLQTIESKKKIYELYVADNQKDLIQQFNKNKIKFKISSKKELDKITNFALHQGIVAKVDDYKTYDLEEITTNKENGLIVLLDGIEDPHNLGAILRSCDATGVDGVIISKNRSASLNATVAKVSTGAIDHVKVCEVVNLSQSIEKLKKLGYWIVGTSVKNSVDYRKIRADVPLVLVIGNEGKGISNLVAKHCDYMVHIPMLGSVESLNASVSCAVLLYNVLNLRDINKK